MRRQVNAVTPATAAAPEADAGLEFLEAVSEDQRQHGGRGGATGGGDPRRAP
jgi:hypothetical protein